VHGDVQGVGFRYHVMRSANALGLRGWVRNVADGSVELVAEGPRPALDSLLEATRQGPRLARVSGVDASWSPAKGGLDAFDLTY
jgi:acylphosphatase